MMGWKVLASGRGARRSAAIHAYAGLNGHGKTLAMVHDTLPSLDAGRTVLSTVPLLDEDGDEHPQYVPLTSWRQLLNLERCDVLLDEVAGSVDARASHVLPGQVRQALNQLRKRDVAMRYTAPDMDHADKRLRQVTQAVTYCKGFAGKGAPSEWVCEQGNGCDGDAVTCPSCVGWQERLWKQRRLFRWRTYDTRDFERLTAHQRSKAKPLQTEVFWRPGSRAERCYSALSEVGTLDHAEAAGSCIHCGGKRRQPVCKCDDEPARPMSADAPRARSGASTHGARAAVVPQGRSRR